MPNDNEPKAFLVSRPLKIPGVSKVASHNYVVSGARYPGDTGKHVKYHSFGKNDKTGMLDRVDSKTKGFSEGTSDQDKAHWKSLSKTNKKDVTRIDAKPETVDAHANGLVADKKYKMIPVLNSSANSNSAAQAIADRSAGKKVHTPDGGRMSPGKSKSANIGFSNRPDLSQQKSQVHKTNRRKQPNQTPAAEAKKGPAETARRPRKKAETGERTKKSLGKTAAKPKSTRKATVAGPKKARPGPKKRGPKL